MPTVRDVIEFWCNEIDFELRNFEWFNIRDYGDIKRLVTKSGADGIVSLCRSLGIPVKRYTETLRRENENENGCCMNIIGRPYIFVRGELEKDHKRAVTARMLGCIFLNVITRARSERYIHNVDGVPLERWDSVEIFARMLLYAMGYTDALKYITDLTERKKKHDTINGARALEVREA